MPFINVKMLEGRTHEQKRELARAITDAMVNICDAKADGTMVVIEDIPAITGREAARFCRSNKGNSGAQFAPLLRYLTGYCTLHILAVCIVI